MFTGIIEAVGTVRAFESRGEVARIQVQIDLPLEDINVGDSLAIDGVCLTVTSRLGNNIWADVSKETLKLTTLKNLVSGAKVNIERALRMTGRLGGHLVQGHVDGVGKIIGIEPNDAGREMTIEFPERLAKYIVEKGAVAINGASFTIAKIDGNTFSVAVIPHTIEHTKTLRAGDEVNLEVDIIGKYVEKLSFMSSEAYHEEGSRVTEEFLRRHGF